MIKSWGRALAVALLILALFVAVLIATAWFALPLDGVTVVAHGQSFSLADLQGLQLASAFCIAVAAVVVAIVAGLAAIVVGLGLGALGLALGLLTAAASLALVLSPLALIAWLLWRLFRERPAAIVTGP